MAATTQVRLLVWSCRYAAEIRGKVDRVPADRRRCLVVVTDAHSRLENKQEMQRPARAQMASLSCPVDLEGLQLSGFPGHQMFITL